MSKSSWTPVPKAEISAWISWFCRILSIRAFSTFRILPRMGRMAWYCGLRPDLAEPPHGVALDDEDLALGGIVRLAVGELARQRRRLQEALAARQVTGLAGRHARGGRLDGLADDVRGLHRIAVEPVREVLVHDLLDEGLRLGVAQLGLGLALELGLAELDRDDRRQTLADVVTREVVVLLAQQLLVARVPVDETGERGRKPSSCVPPSCVWMVLAKEYTPSL